MSINKNLEVRNSPIHGKGVFACGEISTGDFLGAYTGPKASRNGTYVLWVTDEKGEEYGVSGRNKLRYLNHSSEPNAEFDGQELWALDDIQPGEEVTFHYGEDFQDWLDELSAQ